MLKIAWNIKHLTQEWLGKYNTRKYRPCDCQNLVYFPCYNSHRLKLYSFMLEHMTDEQRFQITAKICTEVKWPPTKQWQQTHQNINYNLVHYIQYSSRVSQHPPWKKHGEKWCDTMFVYWKIEEKAQSRTMTAGVHVTHWPLYHSVDIATWNVNKNNICL